VRKEAKGLHGGRMKNNRNNAAKTVFALSSVSLLTLVLATWGCSSKQNSSDEIIKSVISAQGSGVTGGSGNAQVKAFTDSEQADYLWRTCGGCHGPEGAYRSNWDMPAKDKLSATSLEGVAGITRAYQAIVNKYDGNEGASPSAMPIGVDFASNPKAKQEAARALRWFAERLPGVVQDAASLYPRDEKTGASLVTTSEVKVSFNYKCKEVRSGRAYLTKLTSSLFNRNPTDAEFALLGDEGDKPISKEKRTQLSSKIIPKEGTPDPWISEFEEKGLRKFAQKIADAPNIRLADIDPAASRAQIRDDLRDEFYQLLRKHYKEKSYRDILLLDKVMVTSRTAPLYVGCTHSGSTPDTYSECTMPPDRANYFGSVSYMRAKPQSFLENSNNYGRAGAMFIVASGEALLPQTSGPVGAEVSGLPECLTTSTKDARGRVNTTAQAGVDEPLNGPYGSLTIPGFGNVCQGCHVRRGLAAGSKVYRPFGKFGEKIDAAALDAACGTITNGRCQFPAANPYSGDLRMATDADKRSYEAAHERFIKAAPAQKSRGAELDKTVPVTVDFLKQLLAETTDGKGTCIPVDSKTVKPVSSIKEMAEFVVGSEGNVARGLSRLIPKAIAGTQLTNQEVVMEVNKASNSSTPVKGLLPHMIAAYLATETFACQEE
jgi:hypothetical protein